MEFDAGIVISASHNPFEDNGIKVFSGEGEKFDEDLEAHVEQVMADATWSVGPEVGPPVERRDMVVRLHQRTRAPRCPTSRRCGGRRSPSTAPTAPRPRSCRGCSASWGSTPP